MASRITAWRRRCNPASAFAPIRFRFDAAKAAEAAAVLLERRGGTLPYMSVVKLLYLADRESLHRYGRPIVGGRYVAMKLGPVLCEVLDAIRHESVPAWDAAVERCGYDLQLKAQAPAPCQLSDAEIELLRETADLWQKLDQWALSEITHGLAEWRDPGDAAFDIAPEAILRALKKSDEETEAIREAAIESDYFRTLFADPAH